MQARLMIPLTVATALFMQNIDSTVVVTALPAMAASFGEDPVSMKLALTSYIVTLAVFMPIGSWATDRFGPRRVFMAAVALFTLASLACGLASSLVGMVVARAVQGVGGALMVPVGLAVMMRAVPKSEIVQSMIFLTMPALIGPMIGPLLGGFLTTWFNWRWIFWINLPIGILSLVMARLYIPTEPPRAASRLDWLGFVLSGAGLSTLIFGFTILSDPNVPFLAAAGLVVAGIVLLGGYVVHARRVKHPLVDLKPLTIPTVRSGIVGGLYFRITVGAATLLLPLLFQVQFGFSAFMSGSLTFAAALGAMFVKPFATRLLKKHGFRQVLIINCWVCAAFFATYALFTVQTPLWLMSLVIFLSGTARSLQFTSLSALTFADVSTGEMADTSTLHSIFQQFSLSAGIALGGLVLNLSRMARGESTLSAGDFSIAFLVMAVFTLLSLPSIFHLLPNAGANVSGKENPLDQTDSAA